MFKYALIAISILLALTAFAFAIFKATTVEITEETETNGRGDTVFPGGSETPTPRTGNIGTMSVVAKDGGTVRVNDVRSMPGVEVTEIMIEEGKRFVFYRNPGGNGTPGYQLIFIDKLSTFEIILFGEPLKRGRESAESKLVELLGISESDACRLSVSVKALDDVRPELFEVELGLDFCTGSYPL